jgi:hypothetical protein
MVKFLCIFMILCSTALGSGCGASLADDLLDLDSEGSKGDAQALVKVAEDLKALDLFSTSPLTLSVAGSGLRFKQVFGGYSGENVRDFISQRIKYFISFDDLLLLNNSYIRQSDPASDNELNWTHIKNSENFKNKVAASNLGIQLWLQSLIDQEPATITLKNWQRIPITSSRVGIMLIGPAYDASLTQPDGSLVSLPREYRQSLLVHEARHSDCVGGVTQHDLEGVRKVSSYSEFLEKFNSKKCGHLHALCREGDYKDLPACDSMLWGSYGIQALYLEAALEKEVVGSQKWQLLLTTFIDTRNRLQFDYNLDMIQGLEDPDLNSLGLR